MTLTSTKIVNPGTGYLTAPLITVVPVDGNGSGALVHAIVNPGEFYIDSLVIDAAGSAYTKNPLLYVQDNGIGAQLNGIVS